MTNEENIKQMTTEELCDYIYAVYKTGILVGKKQVTEKDTPFVNYKEWLKKEKVEQ